MVISQLYNRFLWYILAFSVCACQVLVTPWSLTACPWLTVWCCTMDSTRKWWYGQLVFADSHTANAFFFPSLKWCLLALLIHMKSGVNTVDIWSCALVNFSLFRCSNRTKRLSTTCVASTRKIISTSYRRSALTTCRASQRASTRSMSETIGQYLSTAIHWSALL